MTTAMISTGAMPPGSQNKEQDNADLSESGDVTEETSAEVVIARYARAQDARLKTFGAV
ncbi:MAG: hypothetical protein NXH97_03595 [Rhodobacteraceae bacterium]|nr:hypothetical protein [Paracoccaceae bacterium]